MKNIIKKIWIEIKPKKDIYISSIFFGFLSAFAMIICFFMFRALIKIIPKITDFYATILSLIIYILLLISSYYYSGYDKDLRKGILYSSIILWVAYIFAMILTKLI